MRASQNCTIKKVTDEFSDGEIRRQYMNNIH